MNFLLLIGGLTLVLFAANWLVKGASAVAKKFKVSDLVIGLTIVAFGTSSPELVTNILASQSGSTDLAVGNILGSNLSNIFLILGIAAIIFPLTVHHGTVWKEIPLAILAALLILILANDEWLDGAPTSIISRSDGMVLLCFMVIFLVYTFEIARKGTPDAVESVQKLPMWMSILMVVGGLVGLYFGGKWFVEGASNIARNLGVSERVIGLTIVAIGTSLPELVTSATAAYHKKTDIAVGNVVGSNIFNIFFILGLTAVLKPLPYSAATINFDAWMGVAAAVLLFGATRAFSKNQIGRSEGVIFILIYVAYLVYLIAFQ